jgi:hypothetical protein
VPPPHGVQILHAHRAINKVDDVSHHDRTSLLTKMYQSGFLFQAGFIGSAKWFRGTAQADRTGAPSRCRD